MVKVIGLLMNISKDKFQILEFIIDCLLQMKWLKSRTKKGNVAVISINIPTNFHLLSLNVFNVVIVIVRQLTILSVQIAPNFH